ncbi:MAG: hypothetical protein M3N57_08315, partial [Actinomycetota bacterium]|nr:hypothetical protein [Actinomycetota bacterium]
QAVDPAVRPHPGATTAARNAIEQLLAVVESTFHEPAGEVPPPPDLSGLREAGIPIASDSEFVVRVGRLDDHRRRLFAYATGTTWPWRQAIDGSQP